MNTVIQSISKRVHPGRLKCFLCVSLLLFYLTFAFPGQAGSAEFDSFDFMRFWNEHPVIKQYDPETGRFKGTKSAPVPLHELEEQIAELTKQLEELGPIKGQLLQESLRGESLLDEDALWARISEVDEQISKLNDELIKKRELHALGGIPDVDTMMEELTKARK